MTGAASQVMVRAGRDGLDTVTTEPATTEAAKRPGSARRWFVIGGIAVILVLIIGYVLAGAAVAGGPVSKADKALSTTLSDDKTIGDMFTNDPFKKVDFNSNNPDISAAKAALATVRQDISRWQADVTRDRAALQQARADLQSSFFTLPEQSTITSHRHRLDAALSALVSAQKAIDIFSKQMAFVDPLFDVIGGFTAIGNAADKNDINAMQTAITTTSASLQKAAALAQSASLPAGIMTGMKTMQQAITDMQALVSAVQAGDAAGVDKYAAAVEAEGKALEATDQNAIDAAERAVFQPLSDAYDRDMKTAAGSG